MSAQSLSCGGFCSLHVRLPWVRRRVSLAALHLYISTSLHFYISTSLHLYTSTQVLVSLAARPHVTRHLPHSGGGCSIRVGEEDNHFCLCNEKWREFCYFKARLKIRTSAKVLANQSEWKVLIVDLQAFMECLFFFTKIKMS